MLSRLWRSQRDMMRPTKARLWHMLAADLDNTTGEVGLDAGAADLKNCFMFRTDQYVGVDIRKDALEAGLKRHPDAIAVVGDLTKVLLPPASIDVCISTNAMWQIPMPGRLTAISNLAKATKPGGKLFIDLSNDSFGAEVVSLLETEFETVQTIYFGNRFSRFYEGLLEDKTGRMPGYTGSIPFLAISAALTLLERVGSGGSGRAHAYVRCLNWNGVAETGPFSLEHFKPLSPHLYSSLT